TVAMESGETAISVRERPKGRILSVEKQSQSFLKKQMPSPRVYSPSDYFRKYWLQMRLWRRTIKVLQIQKVNLKRHHLGVSGKALIPVSKSLPSCPPESPQEAL